MNYQEACEELYRKRLEEKKIKEENRAKFRQSILDKQNSKIVNYAPIRTTNISEVDIDPDFIMPDQLPDNEAKLKWLIFQNLELLEKCPGRKKEAQENIKRIKLFINENM